MIYFILFISWFAHVLSKILDQRIKRKSDFNPIIWIKDSVNYLYVIISFTTALALILSVDTSGAKDYYFYGITFKLSYLFAIAIGWMSASITRALLKKFKKNK